ncbi:probable serine/threonine-protein kinase DDB_G0282963 isoform X2 [Cotesia glomerata]|uniref:probable serine/threonine-protein kinase DDB_G0282963 isoform X2 n=1 Tax=Cotesia glomerata TaxID=32391 RepID=UPI001D02F25A|nr:probable serine/threonine-protein kinase DDB_G0282963 isoform X2 [Cotesia glomerata]
MKKYKVGKDSNNKQKTRTNTEETTSKKKNKEDEETEEVVCLGPSSPKKSKVTSESNNDLSESNYNDYNDVFTLTQDKNQDVSWDWNGTPKSKKNDRTPKRTKLVHKKRISNSPLLYNSTKRKIIRKDNTNNLDKLKADMIALQATITQEKNASNSRAEQSNNGNHIDNDSDNDDNDDDLNIPEELEFDDDFNDESVFVVSLPVDSLPAPANIHGAGDNKNNENIDDMFDDSMNDTMIRCSQEIEKSLKITPPKSKSNKTNNPLNSVNSSSRSKSLNEFVNSAGTSKCQPQSSYKNIPASKPQNYLHAQTLAFKLVSEQSNAKLIKHKSEPINNSSNGGVNPQKNTSNVPVKNNCNENTESIDDGFLDDSFDDFFASCENDLTKTESILLTGQSTDTHFGKVYSPKEESTSKTTTKPNSFLPRVPQKSSTSFPSIKPSCNVNNINRNSSVPAMRPTGAIPKTTSMYNNSNNGNYNNNSNGRGFQRSGSSVNLRPNAPIVTTPKKSQDWKFFKSKSASDSSFEQQTNIKPGLQDTKSHSNLRSSFKVNNTNLNSRGGCRMFAGGSIWRQKKRRS